MMHVWLMIIVGILGFFLKRYGLSPAPLIMGLILGSLVEDTLKQSLIILDHSWLSFLDRPIALVFFALTAVSITAPFIAGWRRASTR